MSTGEIRTKDASPTSPLVMQLIVNKDLLKNEEWTLGPMMAQAAHAATAVIVESYSSPSTRAYTDPINIKNMRKVTLQTIEPLSELSHRLQSAASKDVDFPSHHLWIEEPEHIPTVLAIAPNTKPSVSTK